MTSVFRKSLYSTADSVSRDRSAVLLLIDMEDYGTVSGHTGRKRLLIEHGSDILVCRVSEISCIHTEHGYTKVLLSDGSWGVTEKSLAELETELNPDEFFRANRQSIVNVSAIVKVEPYFHNSYIITTSPDSHGIITVSKERLSLFKSWLNY